MRLSAADYQKLGAYARPFSGQGLAFSPVGVTPRDAPVLHEAGYLSARPHWNYPNVFSPFWRLYHDFEAGHRVVFPGAGREVELGPDKLVLIPDHQLFHTLGSAPRPKLWLHFTAPRRVHPEQQVPIMLRPSDSERAVLAELRTELAARSREARRARIFHLAAALLHLTLSRPELRWLEQAPASLAAALQAIEKRFREPLSNADLARLAGLSERTLTRQFLRYQGVSPRQHLMQVRVRAAAELMLTTRASLAEIAERAGFPNRSYLTRIFAQVTGDSPARFRRTHQRAT